MPQLAPPLAQQGAPDPQKEMQLRRLAMAMMAQGPSPQQQPMGQGGNLFTGLAGGFQQGNRMNQQQQMNDLMGVQSPWQKMLGMFNPSTGGTSGSAAP
jgi:hypothetical protein